MKADMNTMRRTKSARTPLVEGEDYYWEGAAMVFTARFHLKRGTCCGSGCRHCPYDKVVGEAAMIKENAVDAMPK